MAEWNDPRGLTGTLSRGNNIYNGGNNNATRSASAPSRSPFIYGQNPGQASGTRTPTGPPRPDVRPLPGGPGQPPTPAVRPVGSPTPAALEGHYTRPGETTPGRSSIPIPTATPPGDPNRPRIGTPLRDVPGAAVIIDSIFGPGSSMWIGESAVLNADGTISGLPGLTGMTSPITTDPLIEAERANAQLGRDNLEIEGQNQEERINAQLDAIMERLGLQRTDAIEGVEGQMASNGLFRSGINTAEQGKTNEQFNQAGEQAATETATALESIESQIAAQMTGIDQQLNRAEAEFATRAQEQAEEAAATAAAAQQGRIDQLTQEIGRITGIQQSQPTGTPTGQMAYYGQPASSAAVHATPSPVGGQPDMSGLLESLNSINVSQPQTPQQSFSPQTPQADLAGGMNEELRRRLFGA